MVSGASNDVAPIHGLLNRISHFSGVSIAVSLAPFLIANTVRFDHVHIAIGKIFI